MHKITITIVNLKFSSRIQQHHQAQLVFSRFWLASSLSELLQVFRTVILLSFSNLSTNEFIPSTHSRCKLLIKSLKPQFCDSKIFYETQYALFCNKIYLSRLYFLRKMFLVLMLLWSFFMILNVYNR